ncbi:MAG: hypothetical protein IT178_12845, partial [Acidobacteria bacterium]|nr:hypothetical protein [Acidobacteriota bacterium]
MIGHRIVSRHLLCAALLLAGLAAAASADAQPVAAASVAPTSTAFAGEPLTFPVTFDNTGTATGYGPFIDLVLPATGIDGAGTATDDGLTFVSATYLGQPVTAVVRTFNSSGQATHPYAVNNAGTALTVSGTAGDQLVVLLLPFGSFTAAQPAAVVQVTAALSNLADIGAPLAVRARGGFQFGADPLNNPPSDPSITGAFTANAMVTPVLWRLTTTYVGPENETATGPNFPRQYRIDVDVATGQTVTNLALSHQLPANLQFVSVVGTLINGAPAASVNVSTPSTSVPGGTLTRRLASVPGTSGTTDASLIFSAVVPRVDGNAVNVIVPATGDAASVVSDTSASGNWTPVDTRDTPTTVTSNVTATDHTLTARSLAVQKSVAIAIDTGAPGPTPGDTLEYTLALQLSDFFVARNLVFTDIVSDGQRRDPAFVPMLAISEHTGGSFPSSAMDAGNTTFVVDGVTGRTTATFRIGAEQLLRGLDDHLLGGCVPAGGTGVGAIDCTLFNGGATTVTVVYRTVVQETFDGAVPSGDASVDHGDVLSNQVTASASLLSTADALTPTGYTESDTSSATVTIVSGSLTKTIYAINGNTAISLPARLGPGDTVTYRLRYTLPSSDAEPLTITDYLPQPVLEAGQVSTTFSPVVSATPPPAGTARFGPDDTYMGISGLVPSITIDAPGNSVRFGYPAFDDTLNRSSSIDILFTVTATNAPYADGLFLVNHARVHEGSTNAGEAVADAVAQIILNEPNLRITKGVVASSNTARVFAPTTVGPVTFNAPGTLGNRFTGSITSNGLTSAPINSNVSVIDAGDVITFAIAVENIGQAPQGAFDITLNQALPAGFVIPGTGLNLRVANGAGLPMSFTDLGGGLFGTGIRLDDPSATQGALTTYGAVSGTNIAIITFDLQMASTIAANVLLTTTATLGHYAGAEGGPDFTTVDLI